MKIRTLAVTIFILISFFSSRAHAQVLATGETGGKGGQAVLFSANGIFPQGLELVNVYGQYVYGVTDWLDLGPVHGNITALGRTQHYLGLGWNLNLLHRNKTLVDVSFFGTVTVPLNKRNESSTVLSTPAIIVSHPVKISGRLIGLYTGLSTLVPVGQTEGTLFTPPDFVWSVPVGFSAAIFSSWSFYTEVDIHPTFKATGIGLVRVF